MTEAGAGEAVRLAKRVAQQLGCSRATAEQYIEGGWVSVDGRVVEEPAARVAPAQAVALAGDANLLDLRPVTLLLHRPANADAQECLRAERHAAELDPPGTRVLRRHLRALECAAPLPAGASGLAVYTQERRIARRLAEDMALLEQECIVHVEGRIAPDGLQALGRNLPPHGGPAAPHLKASWQNEAHLRLALKGVDMARIPELCAAVGLRVLGVRRIRMGRLPLARLPEGQWRYLQPWERF